MEALVRLFLALALGVFGSAAVGAADRLRLATYNVENYLLADTATRRAKAEPSKTKVAEMVKLMDADVLALQEIGGREALDDLRGRLQGLAVAYPHSEFVHGFDTNIQVALLSRFPIVARRPHTNDAFLLSGRRFRVSRGFVEAEIKVSADFALTVFVAHLKSRRTIAEADEAELRREEAKVLREKVDRRLHDNPRACVAVMGDLNDLRNSEAIRVLIGRGRSALVDTRPAERNGDSGYSPNPRWSPRTVTWTHYFGQEDTYARIDYILLDSNAAARWIPAESQVIAEADWGLASDHRPLVVALGIRPASRK